jgi:hypothetical protein
MWALCQFRLSRLDGLHKDEAWLLVSSPRYISLVEPTNSCSLCKLLVKLLGGKAVETMKDHARRGSVTRIVPKTKDRDCDPDDVVKGAYEWLYEIWSRFGTVATKHFLLCKLRVG